MELTLMEHKLQSYVLAGIAVISAALIIMGNAGGVLFLLWALTSVAVMVLMMRAQGRRAGTAKVRGQGRRPVRGPW